MRRLPLLALLVISAPAAANAQAAVPEPSSLALFGLGITGVIVGRYFARRQPSDD